MLFGIFEILRKLLVELGERVRPLLLTLFDLVELFFQAGGIGNIENVAEIFDAAGP